MFAAEHPLCILARASFEEVGSGFVGGGEGSGYFGGGGVAAAAVGVDGCCGGVEGEEAGYGWVELHY